MITADEARAASVAARSMQVEGLHDVVQEAIKLAAKHGYRYADVPVPPGVLWDEATAFAESIRPLGYVTFVRGTWNKIELRVTW